MPIFISYSQKDKQFVDKLALLLVAARHHVWMDRWELSLGDSLTQKIENALTSASAILVIVSKNSVKSTWMRRELSAGLIRELEEKRTLVMPCVIDDCEIPLFLRDKLYADFRRDPDAAFRLIDQSLSRLSNPAQDRIEELTYHTDWSVTWSDIDGQYHIEWTFIDHGHEWPYVILTQCRVMCDANATKAFKRAEGKGTSNEFNRDVLAAIVASLKGKKLTEKIEGTAEKSIFWTVKTKSIGEFGVFITYRRLGIDNGMDTLIHIDPKLRFALDQMNSKLFKPSKKNRKLIRRRPAKR